MTGFEATAIIRDLGLSQRKFAHLTGWSEDTVSGWARGQTPSRSAVMVVRLLSLRPELIHVIHDEIWGE